MVKTSLKHAVQDYHGNPIMVRSRLEIDVVRILSETNIPWEYEKSKLKYSIPESQHTYIVDFTVGNLLLEGKGRLEDYAERKKYELIKEQHPEIDLRFIFADPDKIVGGTKKTTHKDWATKVGFQWCSVKDKATIQSWIKEKK